MSRLREANQDIIALRMLRANPNRSASATGPEILASDVRDPQEYGEELVGWSSPGERVVGDGVEYFDEEGNERVRVTAPLDADISSVRSDLVLVMDVNARDAMPEGGMLTIETKNVHLDEVYARTHAGVIPGDHCMLAVSDNGCGMDSTTIGHAFEPFFTTKERGEGTGLGLATVYGIVRQHSGTIWVYSEPGIGSTFKIYLPAEDGPARPAAPAAVEAQSGAVGSETVLVVEDDESVRMLVAETLEKHGYTTITAADAVEAIGIAQSFPGDIHLMVTDVIMPKMNGKELHQRISVIRPQTKVIYISGYTDNVIAHHGILESGINFLQKPISVQTLVRKVRDVLDA